MTRKLEKFLGSMHRKVTACPVLKIIKTRNEIAYSLKNGSMIKKGIRGGGVN